jgi:hypothetical protein
MHDLILDWATFAVQVVTLIVLGVYALDTKRMKLEMLRQGTASRRPFLSVVDSRPSEFFGKGQLICNVGEGIAYNVSWKFGSVNKQFPNVVGYLGSMSAGMRVPFAHYGSKKVDGVKTLEITMLHDSPVHINYEDAAGKRYWSTVERNVVGSYVVETGEQKSP